MVSAQTFESLLERLAELVADGELAAALDHIRALTRIARESGEPRIARLHREVIEHKGAFSRLERDRLSARIPREAELAERARIAAVLLELIDEIGRLERTGAGRFPLDAVELPLLAPAARPAPAAAAPSGGASTDIFLSYARPDRALITELAVHLTGRGYSVWFDHYIAGGERFHDAINARLDAALAVIVLWTERSVGSDWVIYEASRAHRAKKLIPLRDHALDIDHIPAPYAAVLNILVCGEFEPLERALRQLCPPRTPRR
jgi:hypothetical protein